MTTPVRVRDLGLTGYEPIFHRMQTFTEERGAETLDEIWFTEHEPVFTQGQAGKEEHLLAPGDIPVVQTDRGGQVTYHGPGQITGYLMFDLRRLKIGVRELVTGIEESMVATVAEYEIKGAPRPDAPGVYVDSDKIGSLGLRVRRGCSYHGLSLNVDMDLEPFSRINPCGLFGVEVTQIANFTPVSIDAVKSVLLGNLLAQYKLEVVG
ncbi:MAG: lipoyl(octanoyl) transferase LipB [Pseudomonadales bacterium]|nr:lipoyl(octanoyl) transferase LipB [Pseudomonadales bacterium]